MKTRFRVSAIVIAAVTGGHAQAVDIIHYKEPAVPVFNWQGFYVGGETRNSWTNTKIDPKNAEGSFSWNPKTNGFVGGVFAGYNFDIGHNIILGVDTDLLWTDITAKDTRSFTTSTIEPGPKIFPPIIEFDADSDRARVKQKWVGATRARIGYAMDRWLPYLSGGAAYARIETSIVDVDVSTHQGTVLFNESKTRLGWTAGGGIDYAVTDKILLRAEYRYTDFGKKNHLLTNGSTQYRFKYKANDFRVGAAYRF